MNKEIALDPEDDRYTDYTGCRHLIPDIISRARLALDVGVSVESLNAIFDKALKKWDPVMTEDERLRTEAVMQKWPGAIAYMVDHPAAGVARFFDGTYSWRELESPETAALRDQQEQESRPPLDIVYRKP